MVMLVHFLPRIVCNNPIGIPSTSSDPKTGIILTIDVFFVTFVRGTINFLLVSRLGLLESAIVSSDRSCGGCIQRETWSSDLFCKMVGLVRHDSWSLVRIVGSWALDISRVCGDALGDDRFTPLSSESINFAFRLYLSRSCLHGLMSWNLSLISKFIQMRALISQVS